MSRASGIGCISDYDDQEVWGGRFQLSLLRKMPLQIESLSFVAEFRESLAIYFRELTEGQKSVQLRRTGKEVVRPFFFLSQIERCLLIKTLLRNAMALSTTHCPGLIDVPCLPCGLTSLRRPRGYMCHVCTLLRMQYREGMISAVSQIFFFLASKYMVKCGQCMQCCIF